MQNTIRFVMCCGILVAFAMGIFPAQAISPVAQRLPCDPHLKSLPSVSLVRRLRQLDHDAWGVNCVTGEFRRRGKEAATAVPELIKLMNEPGASPQTIGNAIAASASIGDAAASAVPEMTRFASSADEDTASMAIWGLDYIGKSGAPAIPALAKIALSDDTSASSLEIKNSAAMALGKLGQYNPGMAGPYLSKLANRSGLLGGTCEGILWMGSSAKPWAAELKPILNRALIDVLRQEAEATPTGNPAEKASTAFIVAHNLEDEITRALAVLSGGTAKQ